MRDICKQHLGKTTLKTTTAADHGSGNGDTEAEESEDDMREHGERACDDWSEDVESSFGEFEDNTAVSCRRESPHQTLRPCGLSAAIVLLRLMLGVVK